MSKKKEIKKEEIQPRPAPINEEDNKQYLIEKEI